MVALLTNRVPVIQGGAEVLELSAKDTKTLYYMPTGGVRRLTLSTVKDLENVRLRWYIVVVHVAGNLARSHQCEGQALLPRACCW